VYACEFSYTRGGNWEDGSWFKANPGKKLATPISTYKLDMVLCANGPSYLEA
jgi:hypothetical protein